MKKLIRFTREQFPKEAVFFHEFIKEPNAVNYFVDRMRQLGICPEFIEIDTDENNPDNAIKELLNVIRELYKKADGPDEWRLWLDIHGGFRDISMAMFAFMRVLSETDIEGVPKLTDGTRVIDISGVFTVLFTPRGKNKEQRPQQIVERTDFFRRFADDTFTAYMNYGQHLQKMLESGDTGHPFAFISYKHEECEKERLVVMSLLKKARVNYWYDDNIQVHQDWDGVIRENLKKCSVLTVLLSRSYFRSDYCRRELRSAMDHGKKIVIIVLDRDADSLPVGKDQELPEGFSAEDMERFGKEQHYFLKKYIFNGVFSDESMRRDFASDKLFIDSDVLNAD